MENNQSHRQNMKVQIREAYGRLVYTYTTHLKQVELLTKISKLSIGRFFYPLFLLADFLVQ